MKEIIGYWPENWNEYMGLTFPKKTIEEARCSFGNDVNIVKIRIGEINDTTNNKM